MTNPDVTAARDLLTKSEPAMRNRSDQMLAAAQVHATLAVEAAVRELMAVVAIPQHTLVEHDGSWYIETKMRATDG
jgi:hypothetical protein